MNEPLAQRLRPKTLADVCGQQHLLAPDRVFRRTIESGRIPNMIFYGPSGTGKTTVARIIAENSGMTLHKLNGTSCGTGDIKAVLKDIAKADLVILDEFGYVPLDIEGSRLLFQVMSDCYEKRSLIVTTNIEFSKWGTVLGDDKLAAATIDRLVHHGRLVEFNGASKRMDAALMLGKSER